ncbi:MAG: FtsW/RodA/SpoVE family cell cycle protein, partial [Planctomycetaceae bacterium]|nr:FtsW/RodA/SpoVE family cell cycle protein [Planctomycetaceae bacterium]
MASEGRLSSDISHFATVSPGIPIVPESTPRTLALCSSKDASAVRSDEGVLVHRHSQDLRRLFVGLTGILVAVGVQMVHSASLTSRPGEADTHFIVRHIMYLTVATGLAAFASQIPSQVIRRNVRFLLPAFVLLLLLVLVPGVGVRVNGAQRWLRLGGLSVQPSEFGRIILPIIAAERVCHLRSGGYSIRILPQLAMPLIIVLPMVAIEPDLGATVFLATGYILALFLGGLPFRYFGGAFLLVAPAAVSLFVLRPYQMKRITGFVQAWQDLTRAPWQIKQSLLSLGAGGLEGEGIGAGWQKLSYLPEANTDFVFAVIGEELGLVGTLTICFVWLTLFLTGRSALSCIRRDSFEWIVGSTLLLQLVLQAMANIAVVTAMVPPKGVPHPFISYGGTNLLVSLLAVGLIYGLTFLKLGARPRSTRFRPPRHRIRE